MKTYRTYIDAYQEQQKSQMFNKKEILPIQTPEGTQYVIIDNKLITQKVIEK